jgi:hypothetical protein
MPTVWAQSVEDIRESPKTLTCTPELSRRVAHLSDVIAIDWPKTVELRSPRYPDRSTQLPDLEIVSVIKKPKYPQRLPRSYVDVDVESPEMMITADAGSTMRPGQEYVFLLQFRNDPNIGWIALYPCGTLNVNDANLAMAREAATEQIE